MGWKKITNRVFVIFEVGKDSVVQEPCLSELVARFIRHGFLLCTENEMKTVINTYIPMYILIKYTFVWHWIFLFNM